MCPIIFITIPNGKNIKTIYFSTEDYSLVGDFGILHIHMLSGLIAPNDEADLVHDFL